MDVEVASQYSRLAVNSVSGTPMAQPLGIGTKNIIV